MSDQTGAIPLGLAQQKAAKNIDPGQLEAMGKRAAALYSESAVPLNEAVVSIVKEARLAPEQVKRVCEFANTAAYLAAFEKAGAVRNVEFDGGPANPSVILKDLNDGSAPAIHQVKTAHYQPPEGHYKRASGSDALLAEAFGFSMEKTAQVDHSQHHRGTEEAVDLRVRLGAMRDEFMSKLSSSGVLLDDVKSDLYSSVREAVCDGASLNDVCRAWSCYGDSNQIKEAMSFVQEGLRRDRVMEHDQQIASLHKTASTGTVPNPAHPVVGRFLAFCKVAHEHRKLEHALNITNEQLASVNTQLRSM